MDAFDSLTATVVGPPPSRQLQQPRHSMFRLRGFFCQLKAFLVFVVLSCSFLPLAASGPCTMNRLQKALDYNACAKYGDGHAFSVQDIAGVDANTDSAEGSLVNAKDVKSVCTDSHSLCFLSTLLDASSDGRKHLEAPLGISRSQSDVPSSVEIVESTPAVTLDGNKSWSSDYGMFRLSNGQTIFCSVDTRDGVDPLSSIGGDSSNQKGLSLSEGPLLAKTSASFRLKHDLEMIKADFRLQLSAQVEISPPVIDWGQKHLYIPSVAFLTVENTRSDSNLHIYEPFSTNIQFYPCNFSELFLRPGESASICIVYSPRWLGLSSAHLILQTSSGGFLVPVKGYAVESPYKISPLISHGAPLGGRLSKNLSLFNPFNETLCVKEVSASILVFQGNISKHNEASCSVETSTDLNNLRLLGTNDWLVVKRDQLGPPLMAMRPHNKWEISPRGSQTIIEIDFSLEFEEEIAGAFCMQLLRSCEGKSETVLVPIQVVLNEKRVYESNADPVTSSLEAVLPSHASNSTSVILSLRNRASYMLSVNKISEVGQRNFFHVKYIKGLLLLPGTATHVGVITCTQNLLQLQDSSPKGLDMNDNCKLVAQTNDSSSALIEIPCQDIIAICLHQNFSTIGINRQSERVESYNVKVVPLDNGVPLAMKALETAEEDEFVLRNWKSHGISGGMSVLDDHEVMFPVVQIGTQMSKWVTIKNPSDQPVAMQLILNTGEVIDGCGHGDDWVLHPSPVSLLHTDFTFGAKHGFSVAKDALTEAYVHPHSKVSFGPIIFHPSSRCEWRTSALIRNNLSGVEWISLRGFGGSGSLLLLEGSDPLGRIEFNLNFPIPLNISPSNMLFQMEKTARVCSQPVLKELHAKNTGDLPLEVERIEVSGTECQLDGFTVHTCNGFSLEPGESRKIMISYQADFSAPMVHRDLQLSVNSGVLVIHPMKASLSSHSFNFCRASVFWVRLKKFSVVALLAAFLMFLVFCCVFPQVIALAPQDYLSKSEKSSNPTVRRANKYSGADFNKIDSKLLVSSEMDSLFRSIGQEKSSKGSSLDEFHDRQDIAQEKGVQVKEIAAGVENHNQVGVLCTQNDVTVPSSLSKSVAAESCVFETSQPCNLTIRTGKEKGRRRRRRKGVSTGLAGLFEVSSSHSGNSTPSSPLSPVLSTTPIRTWSPSPDMDPLEAQNPFSKMDNLRSGKVQGSELTSSPIVLEHKSSPGDCRNNHCSAGHQKPSEPRQKITKPALFHSTAFPSPGDAATNLTPSTMGSPSIIAPHARAPGPKHYNQKAAKVEGMAGDDYTYDIWGDHFSGVHLLDNSKGVSTLRSVARENENESFFVRGPQALVTEPQPKPVSYFKQEG